ncbi:hypothetical protein D3C80_1887930 [compost metagenome]
MYRTSSGASIALTGTQTMPAFRMPYAATRKGMELTHTIATLSPGFRPLASR